MSRRLFAVTQDGVVIFADFGDRTSGWGRQRTEVRIAGRRPTAEEVRACCDLAAVVNLAIEDSLWADREALERCELVVVEAGDPAALRGRS